MDRSLSLRLIGSALLWHSFAGDSARDVCRHLGVERATQATPAELKRTAQERRAAERAHLAVVTEFCRKVWAETHAADGSPVERYLREARGLPCSIPTALRFHEAAPMNYERSARSPAMVAIVTGPRGNAVGLHITALKPDGSDKAFAHRSRRMFGPVKGGAVQLSEIGDTRELAVGEGIESALSFATLNAVPTWAALSTSGLRSFDPPAGLARLLVAADNDAAGVGAARALAERAARRCEVVILAAPAGDWNDELRGRGA
ncbi:toprim domain-containing protein [Phenylobacterium sp.]|uniref:DUF7146 domain-containing protein n=1 Tax=Phenylobacterium sp. TaxID=1871053 RepID=UPI00286AE742|nr:toprim domain-containing protein [Phenylobacterium sp.]